MDMEGTSSNKRDDRVVGSTSSKRPYEQKEGEDGICKFSCNRNENEGIDNAKNTNLTKLSEHVSTFIQSIVNSNGEVFDLQTLSFSRLIKSIIKNKSVQLTTDVDLPNMNIEKGVFRKDKYHFQISEERKSSKDQTKTQHQLIIANTEVMKMDVISTNSMEDKLVEMEDDEWKEKEVIDLNNTGSYWEGGILNGCECFGYGKEYNDENNLVYEGFMFGRMKVCYGKEYRGIRNNNNGLIYEGEYLNGVRYGFGKSYNLNGEVEYEGEWRDDHPSNEVYKVVLKRGNKLILPTSIEELRVCCDRFGDNTAFTMIHFSFPFTQLKKIEIGEECFRTVCKFVLDGMEQLEIVKIEEKCFVSKGVDAKDGLCRITNCPKLRQIELGKAVFAEFTQFELSNVNSLQSIKFDFGCFLNADCILKGRWK